MLVKEWAKLSPRPAGKLLSASSLATTFPFTLLIHSQRIVERQTHLPRPVTASSHLAFPQSAGTASTHFHLVPPILHVASWKAAVTIGIGATLLGASAYAYPNHCRRLQNQRGLYQQNHRPHKSVQHGSGLRLLSRIRSRGDQQDRIGERRRVRRKLPMYLQA